MARFTFAIGNSKKVLALPLYGLGNLAGFVVPRSKKLWVFGSGTGVGEGPLALLLHTRTANPALRLVWMARNARDSADARELGIASVHARTPKGLWLTLRAKVVVVSHGFGDANRYGIRGAFVVQLWHGIPFKHIHLDSPETVRIPLLSRFSFVRQSLRRAYERSARGIRMFATASPLAAARIRTAFGLPDDRVVVTGDPRDDVLAAQTRGRARTTIARLLGLPELPARVLLYAPTWRDGAEDPLIPTEPDWDRIIDYLDATDSQLLVRSHPLGVGDYNVGVARSARIRMLGSNLQGDVTPLLPGIDALITDFSSIAFDYSLVGGPIVFLAPDVVTYSSSRGSYEPFADFSGGFEVADWAGAIDLLRSADRTKSTMAAMTDHTRWLARRVYSFTDGRNTERVYDEIAFRLGMSARPTYRVPALPLVAEAVAVSDGPDPVMTVSGHFTDRAPTSVRLTGPRIALTGTVTIDGSNWSANIPLITARLGGPPLPPPSGRYSLRICDADGRIMDAAVTSAPVAAGLRAGLFRYSLPWSPVGITIALTAPLADDEVGARNQARLRARYRRAGRATADSIFFESYYGQNVSSNPRGIDRAVARLLPNVARNWSVVDASVELPDGATAIIEGSAAWWQARASSRALVVNDWLRKRFRKRRGQTVLQTWHGTPLKQLALDRPGTRFRAALATRREKAYWNIMLAQNQFSADVFRSAYAFRGPIWQEGYPRDDILRSGDGAAVRKRLGISKAAMVILYAPTWRDDRPGKVDHLDVARFARALGSKYVTLIRGHSRTLAPGTEIVADGVLDVTSYPDISNLFLIADILVTDYSSVMFDFSVTGKPIYFYTPDLVHYRDDLRGFYFDLIAEAPGPVISDADELVRRIRKPEPSEFADRYRAWQAKYNPQDDGGAGDRVVRRMIAEGILGERPSA